MGQSDRPERPVNWPPSAPGAGGGVGAEIWKTSVAGSRLPVSVPTYPAVGAVAGRFPSVTLMVRVFAPLPGVVTVRVTV